MHSVISRPILAARTRFYTVKLSQGPQGNVNKTKKKIQPNPSKVSPNFFLPSGRGAQGDAETQLVLAIRLQKEEKNYLVLNTRAFHTFIERKLPRCTN